MSYKTIIHFAKTLFKQALHKISVPRLIPQILEVRMSHYLRARWPLLRVVRQKSHDNINTLVRHIWQ